jgi:hypothetical protein
LLHAVTLTPFCQSQEPHLILLLNTPRLLALPDLICLDHDLFVDSPDDPDPGDGRDVSNFLITQEAQCPVLIHSTNAHAADSMLFSMRDAGWTVDRIAPIGDDWIESYWYPVALEMIARGNDRSNTIKS